MSDIAIQFDNVGKLYHLGTVGTGTLSHDLNRWWQTKILRREDPYLRIGETNDRALKGSSDFVWALKDITFDVEQGDVVGIIGKNGAGKSTLLKLLSRVTSPTVGSIRACGRIASLLEVGTGFHPELTGRENIYMNGSIMGMTRREISSKLDEIVDFAGVARYLDTPVKRYSSGMMVRLGFAVAAFLEPEILVVDEVLAVGDAEFQKKAIGKMKDVSKGEGRTVLFVSHNMAAVQSLCKSGILLQNGMVKFRGNIRDTINQYINTGIHAGNKIVDNITDLMSGLTINKIMINDSEADDIEIPSSAGYIDLKIYGNTQIEGCLNPILALKTETDIVMATYSPNQATGVSYKFPFGDFCIHEKIALPDMVSRGTYNCDIYLFQNQVGIFMKAINCVKITLQGRSRDYGEVFKLEYNGFLGLDKFKD